MRSRNSSILLKADFAKAFDSVNWKFLFSMMIRMGFGHKWVKWIETYLKSSTISILVNRSPTEEFKLERGIRHEDPLSPFLFIIAGEGLNLLMNMATGKGLVCRAAIGKDKIPLSHLQYADDTIFIGSWLKRNIRNVLKVLLCFEEVSGLKINLKKVSYMV
ncbi:secreted RxLR effector protein 78-like [Rutidosis leptorrhynchoides]|uniref:secreted RxLR effector protein 78-like n=1 Tax=Rutidosis leptorrhynchoides TaxID=125765 RepID=UPI003A99908F